MRKMYQAFISSLLLTVLFGIIHSVLAAERVKAFFPISATKYRLLYVVISTVILIVMGIIFRFLKLMVPDCDFELPFWAIILSLVSIFFGGILIVVSFKNIDMAAFLGMKAFSDNQLIMSGVYRCSRHPMYVGTILTFAGGSFLLGNWLYVWIATWFSIYTVIGALHEERRLQKEFPEYAQYRKDVPFLFPLSFKQLKSCLKRRKNF